MLSKDDKAKIGDTVANLQDVCAGLWDVAFSVMDDKPDAGAALRVAAEAIQHQVRELRKMTGKE